MAVRAPMVEERAEFVTQVAALKGKYPEIDAVMADFRALLVMDYALPHVPVDQAKYPRVCATKLDYPPLGLEGLGRFLVTYRVGDRKPSMTDPLCRYTLLTIGET